MATNFPNSLDNGTSLPYPSSSNLTNSPSLASGQDNQNDSLIAIQNKLGITASTPTASNLLIGTGVGTSTWSKLAPTGVIVGTTDSQTLSNKTLTGSTLTSPIITNATLSTDLISGFTSSAIGTVYGIAINAGVITTAGYASSTALQTNAVQANQLSSSAITLGYAQIITSFSTSSTTAVQVTGLTATIIIPNGNRRVRITAYCDSVYSSAASFLALSIWDGVVGSGTKLAGNTQQTTTANQQLYSSVIAIVQPSSGNKIYNIGFSSSSGTGTVFAQSTSPAFILVEAI